MAPTQTSAGMAQDCAKSFHDIVITKKQTRESGTMLSIFKKEIICSPDTDTCMIGLTVITQLPSHLQKNTLTTWHF